MINIVRMINLSMVASIALFFSVVALNNVVDYNGNWHFIQHVMSMDTTFKEPTLMARAITNPNLQRYAYYLIIIWQLMTAVVCWIGCFYLLCHINQPPATFNRAKNIAFIGLFMGFLLYMVGFLIVGGEWFSMWQSAQWNGQHPASIFASMIMFVMIFLQNENSDK
jgi:predicted small integral membrane protein